MVTNKNNKRCITLVHLLPFFFVSGLVTAVNCCDLEEFSNGGKQVSVEESVATSQIAFRGFTLAATSPDYVADIANENKRINAEQQRVDEVDGDETTPLSSPNGGGVFTAYFSLINTYKGASLFEVWGTSNCRQINVTFPATPTECEKGTDVPREYIIFCDVHDGQLRATSVAQWDENTDQRVWAALGWSKWSEWSSCSVSCASGIQQRVRHCLLVEKCPGFNVEQRHCNLFGCEETVNPLALRESRFFHPSKDRWQRVSDRATAWRLKPNSYIWVPSMQLFGDAKTRPFPREFALFVTLRVQNSSMGTVFSLRSRRRQDTYLSLELAGSDLKLIHAASNGTDVVRIPAQLDDNQWHQIAISIRDDSVVDSYVDCGWSRTDILRSHTLDIPEDSDLIIGYLFTGDLEQLSVVSDPRLVSLQCSTLRTPILDPYSNDSSKPRSASTEVRPTLPSPNKIKSLPNEEKLNNKHIVIIKSNAVHRDKHNEEKTLRKIFKVETENDVEISQA